MPTLPRLDLTVRVPTTEALFSEEPVAFPFEGRTLREPTSRYLIDASRRGRAARAIRLEVDVAGSALPPEKEEAVRGEIRAYFRVEAGRAEDDIRLNSVEGRRSLLLSLIGSLIAVAIVLPVRVLVGDPFFLFEFVLVVIIWVLMWDSIEMLVYDSQMLRMRHRALVRLERAEVRFAYRSGPGMTPARPTSGTGQI